MREGEGPALAYEEPSEAHINKVLDRKTEWARRAQTQGLDNVSGKIAARVRFEAFREANPSIGERKDAAQAAGYKTAQELMDTFKAAESHDHDHYQKLKEAFGLNGTWLMTGEGSAFVEHSRDTDIPVEDLKMPSGVTLPSNIQFNVKGSYDPDTKVIHMQLDGGKLDLQVSGPTPG